jgi:hypothetical protein
MITSEQYAEQAKRTALIKSLKAAYAGFSTEGVALFGLVFDSVVARIRDGNIPAAKLIIERFEIPTEVPGVPVDKVSQWPVQQAEILALFP